MPIVRDEPGKAQHNILGEDAQALLPDALDPSCPFCIVLAALPFPTGNAAGEHYCSFHLPLWRRLQCQGWNADHTHQVLAGKARAQQFTPDYQQTAGFASWEAFSARWRASGGLAPLSADAARKYVIPDLIRGACGLAVPPDLQQTIYRAWCAGLLCHVTAWQSDDPPPEPEGLWATQQERHAPSMQHEQGVQHG